jgi:tetratricopeptide (TPR) repeat protein
MEDDSTDQSIARSLSLKETESGEGDPALVDALRRQQAEFLKAQIAQQGLHAKKLDLEFQHLRAEGSLQAEKLKAEVRIAGLANIRERLKLVLDVGLACVGVALIALIGAAVYSATRSQSVVVDAFSVPPDFTAQGNTGVVVAGGFLDRLTTLQNATRADATHHSIEDAWSNDVKIDIPETGVSLGEVLTYLRGWLGHDIHISGSVVHMGDAIVLNVRGSGFPAKSFTGSPAELGKLTSQAAEYVYGQSEPYLYAAWLENNGRDKDAITLVQGVYAGAPEEQRPNLLNAWGNALADFGDIPGSLEKYRAEIRLNPEAWIAYNNIINDKIISGDEEGALQTAAEMERAVKRLGFFSKPVNPVYFQNQQILRMDLPVVYATVIADMEANQGNGTAVTQDAPGVAEFLVRMHDPRAAELELETSPGAGSDPFVIADTAFVRGLIRLFAGQYQAAYLLLVDADRQVSQSPAVATSFYASPACDAALAAEMIGLHDVADADIKRGGHFEICYRHKGDIADHRGRWAEAQKDYAAAVALAPSMPAGYFSWGDALMRHHDYKGAAAKFAQANAKGPHWADPLKRWGDALAAMGDYSGAVAKYRDAEPDAPHWGSLQIAWGHALDRLGRHDEAVTKYRAALGMDITGDEHWNLRGCCG